VVGIAASGTTPYVIGGLEACNKIILLQEVPVMQAAHSQTAQFPIDVVVGPEFVTGSPE
jgi:N-acetylmuramic acid 6-phosphate etherase